MATIEQEARERTPITDVNRFGAVAQLSELDAIWNRRLTAPRPSKMSTYWSKERIAGWLDSEIHNMAVPSAYYGDEMGTYLKNDEDWDLSPLRVAAIGGSSYTGLAGNLGIPLVYSLVNDQNPSFICERSYFPMSRSDLERFEKRGIPIFSLETRRDIKEFDICMFSGSYCGVDVNIIKMLHMSGIPIEYSERDETWPIIGRGGCHSFSPEPFYAIYDWFYIGDAEPQLSNVLRRQAELLEQGVSKWEIMYDMATTTDYRTEAEVKAGKRGIPGIYIPAFHKEIYGDQTAYFSEDLTEKMLKDSPEARHYPHVIDRVVDDTFVPEGKDASIIPLDVDRVYIKDLNEEYLFTKQVVSYHDPGMSAGTLLISRGCNAKCSFCQEGMTWMPYRELSADKAAQTLGDMMQQTGALNVLPSAFCASSYTQKKQLMKRTLESHSDQIKLISQRVDEMAEDENFVMLTGFMGNDTCSLGVEGNSQRIRDMLNKNALSSSEKVLTEDGLVSIADIVGTETRLMTKSGWQSARFESFGEHDVYDVTMTPLYKRGKDGGLRPFKSLRRITRTVRATADHGWILTDGKKHHDLKVGDHVSPIVYEPDEASDDYQLGFTHGMVFGDGQMHHQQVSTGIFYHLLPLFGKMGRLKDRFDKVNWSPSYERVESYAGTAVVYADRNLKEVPADDCTPDYLAGWFQGWHEADGTIGISGGTIRVHSCNLEALEWFADRAALAGLIPVGWWTNPNLENGYGDYTSPLNILHLRNDIEAWHVDSIEHAGSEEVFCANVPEDHAFALQHGIYSGNCTEDELLTATSHLLRAGYKKIKYFMIANIPGETHDDVMEVVSLATKAAALRDEIGSNCDIKFSWTPLVIQSFTPMQFCRPTLEQRSLSEVFPKLKDIGVTFRLGSGAKYDEAYLMQLLHLGDRRIWPIIRDLVVEDGLVHYGSTPKGTKNKIEAFLGDLFPDFEPNWFKNADGVIETENIWDIYFHEKPYDELLTWDFVNVAVTKDYLWKRYLDFQNAVQSTKCDQLCDLCGVCDRFDHQLRHKLHENEDPEVDLSQIKVIKQRGNVQRIRIKVQTPVNRRFVENEYWKFYVRAALYQLDTPLDKRSIQFASDTIPFRNHLFGVDYIDARFYDLVDQKELLANLKNSGIPGKEDLLPHWDILGAKSYLTGMVQIRSLAAMNHYSMPFDAEEEDLVSSRLEKVLSSKEFPVTLRYEGYMGLEREEINARPLVHDLYAVREGTSLLVHMVLENRLSPYDVYAALFPQGMGRIYGIPAERIDSYLKVDDSQEDFFRPTCVECGGSIEITLFDEPVDEDYCNRCKHIEAGLLMEAH